jgi:hypothetical protein
MIIMGHRYAAYPLFYDDISDMEFKKAIFVLRSKNVTTMRELERAFSLNALLSSVEYVSMYCLYSCIVCYIQLILYKIV